MQSYPEIVHKKHQNRAITVCVVIPCYNEATSISEVLQRFEAVDVAQEMIIVDDGSTDGRVPCWRDRGRKSRSPARHLPRT